VWPHALGSEFLIPSPMRLPLWSLVLGVLAHSVLHAANAPPEIWNLKAQQRPGTYLVDITFDLVDPDSFTGVFLSAEASVDNGTTYNLPAKTAVTGDVGLVKPGAGKKMVWDAFTDWPDQYTPTAKVRVIAKDSLTQGPGPGPEGFVWIPPGKFIMGSPEDEPQRGRSGHPATDPSGGDPGFRRPRRVLAAAGHPTLSRGRSWTSAC